MMIRGAGILFISSLVVWLACLYQKLNGAGPAFPGAWHLASKNAPDTSAPSTLNHAPIVKLIAPPRQSLQSWDARIFFSIRVSDEEDGDSKFQEISPKEIFLEVSYLKDTARSKAAQRKEPDRQTGILAMQASNCFNCHNMKTPLIGPSLEQISKRYPDNDSTIRMLKKRIMDGSSGIWGKPVMPTHHELTEKVAGQMARWIMQHGADPALNFYTGTTGSIRLEDFDSASHQGVLILTAHYRDHGLKGIPGKNLTGRDSATIRIH